MPNWWDHPESDSDDDRQRSRLHNTSTLITLTIGVLICYMGLYVVNPLWALFIPDPSIMGGYLQASAGYGDVFVLSWFVASAATVGGGLGSGLESDEAIRAAAYSKREKTVETVWPPDETRRPGCGIDRPLRRLRMKVWTASCAQWYSYGAPRAGALMRAILPRTGLRVPATAAVRRTREDRQYAGDMVTELGHEPAQKGGGLLVGDVVVAGEDVGRELDVGLGGGHLTGVAEAEDPRRLCWATAAPIWPIDAPVTAAGMWSRSSGPRAVRPSRSRSSAHRGWSGCTRE